METNFKISGLARKKMKKELAGLKYSAKMFSFYNDIDKVYGGGCDKSEELDYIEKTKTKILSIEKQLEETL